MATQEHIDQHIAALEADESRMASVKLKLKKSDMYTNAYFVYYEGLMIARVNKRSDDGLTYWQAVVWDENRDPWKMSAEEYRKDALACIKELILAADSFEVVTPDHGLWSEWAYTGMGKYRSFDFRSVIIDRMY